MASYGFRSSGTGGINEEKLDQKVLDTYDYIDEMNKKFDDIEKQIELLKTVYHCEVTDAIVSKFNAFKTDFDIIISNMDQYGKDLAEAKNRFKNMTISEEIFERKEAN